MSQTFNYLAARHEVWCADFNALAAWSSCHDISCATGQPSPRKADGILSLNSAGVATFNVIGPLVKSALPSEKQMGICCYSDLCSALEEAVATPGLKGICLYVDSPGGSFAGLPEAVDMVEAAAKSARTEAVVDGMAASAANWLIAPCAKITASKSAQVGSIGCILTHTSVARALAEQGLDVTIFADGPQKASAHPFRQLSADDGKQLQARVAEYASCFRDSVRKFRPGVSADALSGAMFSAETAKKLGLIDEVGGTIGDSIRRMSTGTPGAAASANFVELCRAEFQRTGSKAAAIAAVAKIHPAAHAAWLASGTTGVPIFQ